MPRRKKLPLVFYLTGSMWLIAVALIALAIRSFASTDNARPAKEVSTVASVRLYDVRDLLPLFNADAANEVPNQMNLFMSGPQTGDEKFTDLLMRFIRPDDWIDAGGTSASAACSDGRLIIVGDASLHREVSAYLRQLRDANANSTIALKD